MSENIVSTRAIGVIGKPHGNKGEMYVLMFTDYPKTIKKGSWLYLDENCIKKVKIENIREIIFKGKTRTIFKFLGFNNRQDAEGLRGLLLYRSLKAQPKLKKDSYWVDELMDCFVYLREGKEIGRVIEVEKFAYNDNLVIRDTAKKIIIVPMFEEYIEDINIKKKKIILKKVPEYI
jgi:16S rRNA processing protein RimM